MKTQALKEQLRRLELKVSNKYSELVSKQDKIVFKNPEDNILERRDEFTGEVYDFYPLEINKEGIKACHDIHQGEPRYPKTIQFHELLDLVNKISLIKLIEQELKK